LTSPRRTGFRQLAENAWHLHGIPKGKLIGRKVRAEQTDQLRREGMLPVRDGTWELPSRGPSTTTSKLAEKKE